MKTIIIILTIILIVSCSKQEPITPITQQITNNPTQTPCNQYGACMDAVYKFNPCNCTGVGNDTVFNSNAKIKYTFVGYHHEPGQPWKDSLKYRLDYVNFDIEIFSHYTDYIYRSYGYNWPHLSVTTKSGKNVVFSSNL